MGRRDVANLRELVNAALRKDKFDTALELYGELEALEPQEPRWPHRKGDLLARLGRIGLAVASFERAVDLYAAEGFLTRAVAMAKVILGFDPKRTDVIERLDPEAARELHRRHRTIALRRSLRAPAGGRVSQLSPAPYPALSPAADAGDDEVRFVNTPSIELDVTAFEIGARTSFPEITVEGMGAEPFGLTSEPEARAPTADELAMLPAFPVFAELPRDAFRTLVARAELVELRDGEVVVRTGEPADSLYAIVEGQARVDVPGADAAEPVILTEGDVLGESCLVAGATRKADVTAVGALVALRIAEADLEALLEAYPPIGDVLFDLLTRRVVGNLMRASPLFAGFDLATRSEIARLFEARKAADGQTIVEREKRSDGLYVLLAGTLELTADGASELVEPITMIGQGSLLSHAPASHTVRSLGEALLLRLPASRFLELAAVYPTVLEGLSELSGLPAAVQLM
jgi:CRP-like cAMP-binding protein